MNSTCYEQDLVYQAVNEADTLPLKAFRLPGIPAALVRATPDRPWMNAFQTSFANRCLPMRIANQDGWFILNPCAVRVQWNGGAHQNDITIEILDGLKTPVLSHFGHGIITWWIPYLFRTPPGYNMHVRGPVNFCKDGIAALHAIVETDWSVASFPMSWKITRPGCSIRFERDEPICMISPVKRGSTESFVPELLPISADPHSAAGHAEWSESRKKHNQSLSRPNPPKKWEKHYFIGTHPGTTDAFAEHQVRLQVRPFAGEHQSATTDVVSVSSTAPLPGSGCPLPHRALRSAGQSVSAPAAAVSASGLLREGNFFARMAEIETFIADWDHPTPARTDVTKPVWVYEHVSGRHALLSCAPETILPLDLMEALIERLCLWGGLHDLGTLKTLQLSLFIDGCFRAPTRTQEGSYFVLPLRTRISSLLQGGRVYSRPEDEVRASSPFGWFRGNFCHPEQNVLLSFPRQAYVGLEKIVGSMDPSGGVLVFEGTLGD